MNNILKIVLLVVAAYIGLHLAFAVLTGLVALVLKVAIPILVVGGILYVVFSMSDKRALGGGRKRFLP